MNNRKLILYIACSADGYIAKPGDDLSFLERVQKEGEDYGYHDFISGIDTVIVGRRTYDWVTEQGFDFPHADKECYIVTRQQRPPLGNIRFYNGSLAALVHTLKGRHGKNIFCDGGGEIVHQLLAEKLLDEMIISIVPVLTGSGIRLFRDGRPEQGLQLLSSRSFDTGLVQLHYRIMA